jgi:group I intron endonuclease
VAPVKIYDNADLQKMQIFQENRYKSGIYMWKNNITDKRYVGSSVDIRRRMFQYFNPKYLVTVLKRGRSKISASLLKGYSRYSLHILEYCEKSDLITREQYYIDLLKPEYNLLNQAGSLRGNK